MQTAIYCDTFGLQSFGARNSSLCDSVQFLLCFILNLRAISNFNGEFFALRVGGGGGGGGFFGGGLYLEGLIIHGGAYFWNFTVICVRCFNLFVVDSMPNPRLSDR